MASESKLNKYEEDRDKIEQMSKTLWDMRHTDTFYGIGNYYLNEFLCSYYAQTIPMIMEWFDKVWEEQKKKKDSYGDIDYSLIKLFEGDVIEDGRGRKQGDTKKVRAMKVEEHSGSGTWLVLHEEKSNEELSKLTNGRITSDQKLHVRVLYNPSDYKKGNQYVSCPNEKWYKDRGWDLQYIEKFHMTPLGGQYGDMRDKGYVITAVKRHYENKWRIEHIGHRMFQFEEAARNIGGAAIYGNK